MRGSDSAYLEERLEAERAAVRAAVCDRAKAAHQAMAELYEERLAAAMEAEPRLRLVAGGRR